MRSSKTLGLAVFVMLAAPFFASLAAPVGASPKFHPYEGPKPIAVWVQTEERRIEHEILRDLHRELRVIREELATMRRETLEP